MRAGKDSGARQRLGLSAHPAAAAEAVMTSAASQAARRAGRPAGRPAVTAASAAQ